MNKMGDEFIFYLPGVPAPIGGFKVVYEHAQILQNAGAKVKVIHVNPAICEGNSAFMLSLKKLYFFYRILFDRWRKYPHQYEIAMNYSNNLREMSSSALHIVASWQLMNFISENAKVDKFKIVHLAMDYPKFMGPTEDVKRSWRIGEKYLAVSTHLVESISAERANTNLPEIVKYVPSITKKSGCVSSTKKRVLRLFCVVSSGKYKNQKNLIKLLNLLSDHIEVVTFSRDPRPAALSKHIRHFTNLSDHEIQEYYLTSEFSLSYSTFEGFCLPGFEAMLNGAVLFTTDSLGNQDYIKPGLNCINLSGTNVTDDFIVIKNFIDQGMMKIQAYRECGYKSTSEYLEKYNTDYILSTYFEMAS